MSRPEPKLTGRMGQPVDASDILFALERMAAGEADNRSGAIATYLSGEEGWQDASIVLDGAFSSAGAKGGLTRPKGE